MLKTLSIKLLITLAAFSAGSPQMSLREKVGTLFFIRPESLVDTLSAEQVKNSDKNPCLGLDEQMRQAYRLRPAGGFCLFAHNLSSNAQLRQFISELHALDGRPLVSIDEEGGRVSRLANSPQFGIKNQGFAGDIAATGRLGVARRAGRNIGRYLKRYGFDIDFAPVADVNTNPENIVIGKRAFGSDAVMAGKMSSAWLKGLQSTGIRGCLKHFPGHGDTKEDTHAGFAASPKNRDELLNCELIPFREGIKAGAEMVMVAHISLKNVNGSDIPSTMSPEVMTELLRKELGFDGVIVTDAMEMGAITGAVSAGEAALAAILAGADIVLMPYGYKEAFDFVLGAVLDGRLSEKRLDESIERIKKLKK